MKNETANNTEKKINLRELNDTDCTIVVCSRQIRKMIKKFPSMADTAIDCWVNRGHYTRFKLKNNKFTWVSEGFEPHLPGYEVIDEDSVLCSDDFYKLTVETFQAMCDSQNGVDISDTPEDLLTYAELKLQELISEESGGSDSINNAVV